MNIKKLTFSTIFILTCSAFLGCSKNANEPSSATGNESNNTSNAATNLTEMAKQMQLPQPDKSMSLDQYHVIDSGNTIMYSYYGLSKMPPDIDKLAELLSSDYRMTQDQFKKQDILKVLEPKIKENIAAHGSNRYFLWTTDDSANNIIDHYDFNRKVFPIKEKYWDGSNRYYWSDNTAYTMSFTGTDSTHAFKVEDEATTRRIEQMLTNYSRNAKLYVYVYAQDFDLNDKQMKTVVTCFELRDNKGNVLAKQSM